MVWPITALHLVGSVVSLLSSQSAVITQPIMERDNSTYSILQRFAANVKLEALAIFAL